MHKRIATCLILALFLCLNACAERHRSPAVPAAALITKGPALFIAGEYEGMSLEGAMDRTCMLGIGSIRLRGQNTEGQEFVCAAEMNAPPTEKGRLRGSLQCTKDRVLMFSLRNLGPDQGLGIAREFDHDSVMVFFYHASREEAGRRLPAVKEDIARALRAGIR